MGMLIDGVWSDEDRVIQDGAYRRPASGFGGKIDAATIAGLRGSPGRFHLIASSSCPWSHRAMLVRRLKGLAACVPMQIAGGERVQGYPANGGAGWTVPGTATTIVHLHQLYTLSDPGFTGRVTVPALWDARERRIVSNESAKIIRAFDAAPAGAGPTGTGPAGEGPDFTLVPGRLRGAIDDLNRRLYDGLSNAVYRAGFAEAQPAYDAAVAEVFDTLDWLEARLSGQRYLHGAVLTETDWRLFPTLVRFDAIYHVLFRCARRRLADYPALWAYARDLHGWAGVAETVDFDIMRAASHRSDRTNNPTGIVAVAPDVDWLAPHTREALGPAQIMSRTGEPVAVDPATLEPRVPQGV